MPWGICCSKSESSLIRHISLQVNNDYSLKGLPVLPPASLGIFNIPLLVFFFFFFYNSLLIFLFTIHLQ